jgi:photosystem II stability/assembly factor-like uncharacterized protein
MRRRVLFPWKLPNQPPPPNVKMAMTVAHALLRAASALLPTLLAAQSLRGISAVSSSVAWASGTGGTILRTIDGGRNWEPKPIPETTGLDFRAIRAFNSNLAIAMSAGPGDRSRIYKTADGGTHWDLLLKNEFPQGFFDAIAFWDEKRGIVLGDQVNGRMYVAATADGGKTWTRVSDTTLPAARPGEGAFAASGTCLIAGDRGRAWFATGGSGGGRVFRSTDWAQSWRVSETPIRHEADASGIFSIAFRDAMRGVAVGGNYAKPAEDRDNIAITQDGGRTWTAPAGNRPAGYRSAVAYAPNRREIIAAGTTGTDRSKDGGVTWTPVNRDKVNALSFAPDGSAWAVGPDRFLAVIVTVN